MPTIRSTYREQIDLKYDLRRAATLLRDVAFKLGKFRVGALENIAADQFMRDCEGRNLNEEIFGWTLEKEHWWNLPGILYNSPIIAAARYQSQPFWYDQRGFYTRSPNPILSTIDLSRIGQLTMRKVGIVVPIHLPLGRVAAVGFSPICADRYDLEAEFSAYAEELEFAARTFIVGYINAMDAMKVTAPAATLSQREVECLRWAAAGKTDSEIAQIIARSHATIRFHVRSAIGKLDAVNRSQAVFKASQLGYLGSVN
jgi:LuxR family transcriptional regulator, quorum-sensing system regulator CciR